jgi:hypothetical protein
MQRKSCWVNTSNYQFARWKHQIRHTELDTETLHGLQEAYLIANHMMVKIPSENLQKQQRNVIVRLL